MHVREHPVAEEENKHSFAKLPTNRTESFLNLFNQMESKNEMLSFVPYLNVATEEKWRKFVEEYDSYRARGGQRELRSLVSVKAWRLLRIRVGEQLDKADEDELRILINKLFEPKSSLEALEKFRALSITDHKTVQVDGVAQLAMSFMDVLDSCKNHVPPENMIRKMFVSKLKPKRLRDLVELKQPKSLDEAVAVAMSEAEHLQSMTQQAVPQWTEVAASKPKRHAKDESPKDKKPEKPKGRGVVRCYGCGEEGHIKPNCPNKDRWQTREAKGSANFKDQVKVVTRTGPRNNETTGSDTKIVKETENKSADAQEVKESVVSTTEHQDMPRVPLELHAPDGNVTVMALLDTGATVNLMSPEVARKLEKRGVELHVAHHELKTASPGPIWCHQEVDLTVEVNRGVSRPVVTQVHFCVLDSGEEALLGYPWLRETGLLSALVDGETRVIHLDDPEDIEEKLGDPDYSHKVIDEPEFRSEIDGIVEDFADLFGEFPSEGADVPPFRIELKEGANIRAIPPRRMSPRLLAALRAEISDFRSRGIITESVSPYSFPVVMVRKPDGTWRTCIDYRELNSATVDLKFPLQNYRAILDRMKGQRVFGIIDLRQGFHQIPLDPESRRLTAFATPDGLHEYLRMPMGVKNAPSYFQKVMMDILQDLVGVSCEVFIDDIIVYGRDQREFLDRLRTVLERFRRHRLRLKLSKCQFGLSQVEYVGHIVNGDGIALSDRRREALRQIRAPTSTAELRSFLGLANYFRQFVPNYAVVSKPLTALCSPKVAFRWAEEQETAFQTLKKAACNCQLLSHLDYDRPIILRTDASTLGVGGVLFQMGEEGRERPIAFVSKAFNETEQRWSTIEQEAFAIFYCIRQLEHYLRGHKFEVQTDHRNLTYMNKSQVPKVVRWRLALMEYDFVVRHIPGRENTVADALSRVLCVAEAGGEPETAVQDRQHDIRMVHNSVVGHGGITRTLGLLRDQGKEWPTREADVKAFIRSCAVCQKTRLGQGGNFPEFRTTMTSEPFSEISVDTIGPLPRDDQGNKYILCVIDSFSRFVELYACKDTSAKEAVRGLMDVMGRYGAPRMIRSDQGSQFTAHLVQEFVAVCETASKFTLPYRPQANGIVERVNGEVMRHLRALVFTGRLSEQWSSWLPLIQRIVNASVHSATGQAPVTLMFAGAVTQDRELIRPSRAGEMVPVDDYVRDMVDVQAELVRTSQAHQQQVISAYVERGPKEPTRFESGDLVLVSYPGRPPSKLAPRWRGPMVVIAVEGNHHSCRDLRTGNVLELDVTRLKEYRQDLENDDLEVAARDADEHVVEAIVEHRGNARRRSSLQFRVRWAGYEPSEDTWEAYRDVKDLAALDEYARGHPELRL